MFIKPLIIAFSMYSKIPMPKVNWEDKAMKYAFCFFPLIGVAIGAIMWIVGNFMLSYNVKPFIIGSVMTVLPILITGGIHLDGFLDTIDGISSYADKERRIEILKDSNSGAFAIIGGLCYFVISLGFWSCINIEVLNFVSMSFILSRALSAMAVVTFPRAKKTGLAATFSNSAHKRVVFITMLFYIIVAFSALFIINKIYAAIIIVLSLICFLYHYLNCVKNFGGITGDLAGYFLEIYELMFIIAAVILYGQGVAL